MPRIPLVSEASMTDAQRRVYDAMMSGPRRSPPVGPLAAAMHRPDLAEKWSDLGLVLRFNSSFPPRLREFVILLTGRHWDCQFEWFSHEAEARKAGLSDQSIETLRHGGNTFQAADEQAIHDYAIELLRDHHASDATYQRVLDGVRHRRHRRTDRADRLLLDGRADAERARDRRARGRHAAAAVLARPRRQGLAIPP